MEATIIKRPIQHSDIGHMAIMPSDRMAAEEFNRLKIHKLYRARVWEPRNLKYHRLFFGLSRLIVENSEKWQTVEQFRHAFLVYIGKVQVVPGVDGTPVAVPDSMSFEKMDEETFDREVMERFWPVVAKELDLDEGELRADYQRILGGAW